VSSSPISPALGQVGDLPAGDRALLAGQCPSLAEHLAVGGIVYAAGLAWAYRSGRALHVGALQREVKKPDAEILTAEIETLPDDV